MSGSRGPVSREGPLQQFQGPERDRRIAYLEAIRAKEEKHILSIPGVIGFGIGLMEDGKTLGFIVYCEALTPEVQSQVPRYLKNIPVRLIESGVFKAY